LDAAGSSLDWQNRGHSCRSAVNHRRASIPPEIVVLDPSCVSSTPQLKREQSLWPEFGCDHGICASFQRDNLRRHFRVRVLLYRGGLVSSAFRLLRRSGVGCSSQGPRFSSGSALGPSHDGIRRMRRTNLRRRPCRKTYGRHKDSKRTRLIHRPCGDIAPPVGGIRVFSCCVSIVHNSLRDT
jgi:hypothetical protein